MTREANKPQAHIEVIRATVDQAPIVANLLELYIHDFSEIHNVELGPDGRFGYKNLQLYWTEPNRHPFLIWLDSKLAGLILVKKGSGISGDETVWDMAEFFVVRGFRRRGIGTQIAHEVWRRFPGQWEVRVMESNRHAYYFWEQALTKYGGHSIHSVRVENSGNYWHLFSFKSPS